VKLKRKINLIKGLKNKIIKNLKIKLKNNIWRKFENNSRFYKMIKIKIKTQKNKS
jgi:hypothetical protein